MRKHIDLVTKVSYLPAAASDTVMPPDNIWGILAQKWGLKQF